MPRPVHYVDARRYTEAFHERVVPRPVHYVDARRYTDIGPSEMMFGPTVRGILRNVIIHNIIWI